MDIFQEKQPDNLYISQKLRLGKFQEIVPQALSWYQDEQILRLISRQNIAPYDQTRLKRMYDYLNGRGELYYIEYMTGNRFIKIGDVTLMPHDLPIVIGNPKFRGKGIARQIIHGLVARTFAQGMTEVYVEDIYNDNIGSQRAFEKCGFTRDKKTIFGHSYHLLAH
ncbi:MAG: histone acetyltransferase [Sporolactobacillus laevolacticus]|nr:histone acetyltransferase [Sporolactobacillus laevolacticus]